MAKHSLNFFPGVIYASYFPWQNISKNAFMDPDKCDKSNMWGCAFLNTTNCSFPEQLTKGIKYQGNTDSTHGYTHIFSSATSEGKHFNKDDPRLKKLPQTTSSGNFDFRKYFSGDYSDLFGYGYQLRYAYRFRERTEELLDFYSTNSKFKESKPCISVHFRRGERQIPSKYNIQEFCYNVTHNLPCVADHTTCSFKDNVGCHEVKKGDGSSMGYTAFSSQNLSHVLKGVRDSPDFKDKDIKNFLVFSDDTEFVREQIELMKIKEPKLIFEHFPSPNEMDRAKEKIARRIEMSNDMSGGVRPVEGINATANLDHGAYYFSSLDAASKCQGLVGNFNSGATAMYRNRMCLKFKEEVDIWRCNPTVGLSDIIL